MTVAKLISLLLMGCPRGLHENLILFRAYTSKKIAGGRSVSVDISVLQNRWFCRRVLILLTPATIVFSISIEYVLLKINLAHAF